MRESRNMRKFEKMTKLKKMKKKPNRLRKMKKNMKKKRKKRRRKMKTMNLWKNKRSTPKNWMRCWTEIVSSIGNVNYWNLKSMNSRNRSGPTSVENNNLKSINSSLRREKWILIQTKFWQSQPSKSSSSTITTHFPKTSTRIDLSSFSSPKTPTRAWKSASECSINSFKKEAI